MCFEYSLIDLFERLLFVEIIFKIEYVVLKIVKINWEKLCELRFFVWLFIVKCFFGVFLFVFVLICLVVSKFFLLLIVYYYGNVLFGIEREILFIMIVVFLIILEVYMFLKVFWKV